MIAIVTSIEVHPEKVADFEARFLELTAQVRANEPGNLLYQLARLPAKPGAYKVLVLFADQTAFEAHQTADFVQKIVPGIVACFSSPLTSEVMEAVQ